MIVDGYVRVFQVAGREGDSFMSPVLQREQIERWAERSGAFVGHVFEELDESGARSDRPLLERAIRRVEAGESDGVVVADLSRFGRSLADGLAAIKRITDANASWRVACERATARGVWMGSPPYGSYRKAIASMST